MAFFTVKGQVSRASCCSHKKCNSITNSTNYSEIYNVSYADHFNHTCCGFSFPNIRFTISSSDIMMVTSPLATKKRSLKFLTQKHAQRPTYKFHQRPSLVQILTIDSELDRSVPVLSIHHPYTFLPT